MPDWYLDRPDSEEVEEWYVDAFWALSTCRYFTDSAVGPIPWRDIVLYAQVHKLADDFFPIFHRVISEMDAGYLKDQRAEMNRKSRKRHLNDEREQESK